MTVIKAGPCPIIKVKTVGTGRLEAVQLAFDKVPARKISKAERGHLEASSSRTGAWSSSAARRS